VCGLAYCQEGLTDGFIPEEALPYLGVKSAGAMTKHLEAAGLWERVDGGWQVHDYLSHNRKAAEVNQIRASRAAGGRHGGRPHKKPSGNLEGFTDVHQEGLTGSESEKTFPVDVAVVAPEAVAVPDQKKDVAEFPGDVWWAALLSAYPQNRVTNNHIANQAFIKALTTAKDGPRSAWERMSNNLNNQKRGHEWRVKGMIPSLQKWLESGAWEQRHEESPAATLMTDRTANTLAAAAAAKKLSR
jgi:hypothetical protein